MPQGTVVVASHVTLSNAFIGARGLTTLGLDGVKRRGAEGVEATPLSRSKLGLGVVGADWRTLDVFWV